jgi:hypothetical protein
MAGVNEPAMPEPINPMRYDVLLVMRVLPRKRLDARI